MLNIFQGQRPDITPAQIIAGITSAFAAVPSVCVLVGIHLSVQQDAALTDLRKLAVGLAVSLIGGDALIRIGRNHSDGKVKAAGLIAAGNAGQNSRPVADMPPAAGPTDFPEPSTEPPLLPTESATGADPGAPPIRPLED